MFGCIEKIYSFACFSNLQTDPKRLKKDLPKIIKGMKGDDRVLILGTSLFPYSILFVIFLLLRCSSVSQSFLTNDILAWKFELFGGLGFFHFSHSLFGLEKNVDNTNLFKVLLWLQLSKVDCTWKCWSILVNFQY